MNLKKVFLGAGAVALGFSLLVSGAAASGNKASGALKASIERGKYLVEGPGDCSDCHTPWHMDPKLNEPVPDMSRYLAGSPEGASRPEIKLTSPSQVSWDMVADSWSGGWGTSFPANLTPDKETGIGNWTFQDFYNVIHEGKFKSQWSNKGDGRPIMPPMPWEHFSRMTRQDLRDIFNYLKSLKPVKNKVPEYIPPPGGESAH